MRELDVLLLGYLERQYPTATVEQQRIFADLLELQDMQLYDYLLGRATPADAAVVDVIETIRTAAHA